MGSGCRDSHCNRRLSVHWDGGQAHRRTTGHPAQDTRPWEQQLLRPWVRRASVIGGFIKRLLMKVTHSTGGRPWARGCVSEKRLLLCVMRDRANPLNQAELSLNPLMMAVFSLVRRTVPYKPLWCGRGGDGDEGRTERGCLQMAFLGAETWGTTPPGPWLLLCNGWAGTLCSPARSLGRNWAGREAACGLQSDPVTGCWVTGPQHAEHLPCAECRACTQGLSSGGPQQMSMGLGEEGSENTRGLVRALPGVDMAPMSHLGRALLEFGDPVSPGVWRSSLLGVRRSSLMGSGCSMLWSHTQLVIPSPPPRTLVLPI